MTRLLAAAAAVLTLTACAATPPPEPGRLSEFERGTGTAHVSRCGGLC